MRIAIEDTALGRHRATMKRQLISSVATMTPEERVALREEIKMFESADSPTDAAGSLGDLAMVAEEVTDGELV